MRSKLLLPVMIVFFGMIINSCSKEYSCEHCLEGNKPPIADAGIDQLVILPKDSTTINGKASKDPDGFIVSYKWRMTSPNPSLIIVYPDSAITMLRGMVAGVYNLELKVTDNEGLSSTDTLRIRVNNAGQANQPPVAKAGPDQTYKLPANSIVVDGNESYDPDGFIVSYLWKQIEGPNQINIVEPKKAASVVNSLTGGHYMFELTVTDNGGLSSKDTIQISEYVDPMCGSGRPLIEAKLVHIGDLSEARVGIISATVSSKILFAGGFAGWNPVNVSKRVDIYDYALNTWSTADLSITRQGMSIASVGNKIFIAGGTDTATKKDYSRIDIYDAANNTWSITELSEARSDISSISMGDKIYFAGGSRWVNNNLEFSNRVDIYNTTTGTWSTASLSQARSSVVANLINDKIYFAGGRTNGEAISDQIDIYDGVTNSWSTSKLVERKYLFAGVSTKGYIYWAGGLNGTTVPTSGATSQVEIRDVETQTSTISCLQRWREAVTGVLNGDDILFFPGYPNTDVQDNVFDIFNSVTKTWFIAELYYGTVDQSCIISAGGNIYVAGGENRLYGFNKEVYLLKY